MAHSMTGMLLPFKPVQTGNPSCRGTAPIAGVHTLVAGSSRQRCLSAQMPHSLLHTSHELYRWGARLQGTSVRGQEPYLLLAYSSVMPEERQLDELQASQLASSATKSKPSCATSLTHTGHSKGPTV